MAVAKKKAAPAKAGAKKAIPKKGMGGASKNKC